MKRFIALFIVAVLMCSTIFVPTFAQSSPGVKEEYLNEDKWLSLSKNTTGARYFVNSKGEPVRLFGTARAQSHASTENTMYSEGSVADLDSLFGYYSGYGCNFTRLAINSSAITGGEKRTSEEIQEFITKYVDPDVQAIIRNGMYVMLDVHMYAPTENTTLEACMKHAYDFFQPLAVELAKRYKDEPMVAVIELWNEPVAADNQNLPFEGAGWLEQLREYFINTVAEIRKYDTRHVLLVSDHNAGWGGALPEMWNGYYDKVDPVYNNTCFSVHASHTQLESDWYFNAWESWTTSNNICLLFGEVETEPGISSEKGMQNFFKMLDESVDKNIHYSTAIWRPHGYTGEYQHLWTTNGWAKNYATPQPSPSARYASETEDVNAAVNTKVAELVKAPDLFGAKTGTGISLLPNLATTNYYEAETSTELIDNVIYKEGKYDLVVRACGNAGYEGDFIVGYRDIDGTVHQIARFSGKNTKGEHYYQKVSFTATKKIVGFVYFSCEKSKKSAVIDRVYLTGAASNIGTTSRMKANVKDVNKVIDLNGKSYTIAVKAPETSTNNNSGTVGGNDSYSDSADGYEDESEDENESESDKEQVVATGSGKTTVLQHKIINNDASALTITMFISIGVLVLLGIAVVVILIVRKSKNRIKI